MKIISVITVVYNDVDHISNTIESVLSQNVPVSDIEYIVIDGGSTDGTVDKVKSFGDKISVFISEKDTGIYNAMNKGIKYATAKWCMFLNSGDLLVKGALHALEENFNSNAAVLFGNTICSFSLGQIKYKEDYKEDEFPPVRHQSSFINTEVMKKYGYDESYKICADLDFFKKIYDLKYKFQYINKDVAVYDMDGVSAHSIMQYAKEKRLIGFKMSNADILKFRLKNILFRVAPKLYTYMYYNSMKKKHS